MIKNTHHLASQRNTILGLLWVLLSLRVLIDPCYNDEPHQPSNPSWAKGTKQNIFAKNKRYPPECPRALRVGTAFWRRILCGGAGTKKFSKNVLVVPPYFWRGSFPILIMATSTPTIARTMVTCTAAALDGVGLGHPDGVERGQIALRAVMLGLRAVRVLGRESLVVVGLLAQKLSYFYLEHIFLRFYFV